MAKIRVLTWYFRTAEAFLNNPKIQLQALYVYLSARDRLSADIVFKNACKSFENDNKEPQDLRAMFSVMARIYAISNSTSKIDELIDLYKAYWGSYAPSEASFVF
jgi:hypothetical protein